MGCEVEVFMVAEGVRMCAGGGGAMWGGGAGGGWSLLFVPWTCG